MQRHAFFTRSGQWRDVLYYLKMRAELDYENSAEHPEVYAELKRRTAGGWKLITARSSEVHEEEGLAVVTITFRKWRWS